MHIIYILKIINIEDNFNVDLKTSNILVEIMVNILLRSIT